jgi:hypothetical protein
MQAVKGRIEVVLYLLALCPLTVVHRDRFNPELEGPFTTLLAKNADADYIGYELAVLISSTSVPAANGRHSPSGDAFTGSPFIIWRAFSCCNQL